MDKARYNNEKEANRVKKTMRLLLASLLLMAAICMFSCGNDDGDATRGSEDNAAGGSDAQQSEPEIKDSLPEGLEFGGIAINLLIPGGEVNQVTMDEFYAESDTGDIINDAVYRRNMAVEERLNLKLNVICGPDLHHWDEMNKMIRTSILANDDAYQLIAGWSARAPALALDGLFLDLKTLSYLNLSEPWWTQSITEELTLGGKLHFAAGDMTTSMIASCSVIFFNKKLQQDYTVPDLYQIVLDGKWTLDYMDGLSRGISSDLNGDGIMDENDLYGAAYTTLNVVDGFLQSSNIKMTRNDDRGMPYLDMEYEKIGVLIDKAYTLLYENPGAYTLQGDNFENLVCKQFDMFKNDQVLLLPQVLLPNFIGQLRDMKSDYGIIPYPKFDEFQEKYLSRIWDIVSLMCVPLNCGAPDAVGALMEAMGSESYRNLTPVYYETALKIKYSRDSISSQMIDIIREGAYLNFASIYNESIEYPWFCMRDLMTNKRNNFSSWHEKNEPRIAKRINSVIEKYLDSET